MRYLTKEWYYTMNDSGLGVCLEADERAAECSEEMYQTLRAEKLARWLRDRKAVCEVLEQPFDPAGEERSFGEFCRNELEHYHARMPERILSKVADQRVLALGYCTEEVWQELEDFRRECEARTEQTMEDAWNACKAAGLDKIWTGEHSLHDSSVLSFGWDGKDLVLEFDREEETWRTVRQIIFREASILTMEKSPEDAWWLYDEIHRSERGYEIHALLWQDGLAELTVECADVELVWTMESP
jgi:hypothetical protein